MPKNTNLTATTLNIFIQYGFRPNRTSGEKQVYGSCIFCDGIDKFYVNVDTKAWDCKACGKEGGTATFLKRVLEYYKKQTTEKDLQVLAKHRNLEVDTLKRAGIVYARPVKSYLLPVWDARREKIWDIRRYKLTIKNLLSTSGCEVGLYGWEYLAQNFVNIWLCEGEWDCLTMREALHKLKKDDEIAIAAPGAQTFKQKWQAMFKDMNVNVLYDNDQPGRDGAVKVYNLIGPLTRTISFLHWRENAPEHEDVRDLYIKVNKNPDKLFRRLKLRLEKEPQDIENSNIVSTVIQTNRYKYEGKGHTAEEVRNTYTKWLTLKDVNVIDVLYGAMIANRMPGDPVWLFLVALSGGIKSELIMSLDDVVNVTSVSDLTVNTLISGGTFAGGGDPSLIPRLNEGILLIKDFTGFLEMNHDQQRAIFKQLRDAFDGKCAKPLGTGVFRKYNSKFGVIAGVTPAVELYLLGESAIGARFIHWEIPEPKNFKEEMDMIHGATGNMLEKEIMRTEFRKMAKETLDHNYQIVPEVSKEIDTNVKQLALLTAYMRGTVIRDKYSKEITHKPIRELATRLAQEYLKHMYGITMFRRLKKVTMNEYDLIKHVTYSTTPSKVRLMLRLMYLRGKERAWSLQQLTELVNLPAITTERTAEDLRMLGLLEKAGRGKIQVREWAMSDKFLEVFKSTGLFK